MKILITGARGFIGKNLAASLMNIRDGKDMVHTVPDGAENLSIISYDIDSSREVLESACRDCDFVFNFAGVNRPEKQEEFMQGNFDFAAALLETLKKYRNTCPVMLSSSIQAALTGRFADSEYGRSKLASEELFFRYAKETGARVLVYRFTNLFGKWCRPNYNSVVATFCHNIARDLPIRVDDRSTELTMLYIDDLLEEMLRALNGQEHRRDDGQLHTYCYVPVTYKVTLGEIVDCLKEFHAQSQTLMLPDMPENSFVKKLYSTYLSYLPKEKIAFPLKMNANDYGSFTELLKTRSCGQVSVNISKPGVTKGQHWHHSKWEFFIVVSGHALIQERQIGTDEIIEFEVSGEKLEAVHMLPGYTHNIINLSDTENLVTVMWANEVFEPECPDTYRESVRLQEG